MIGTDGRRRVIITNIAPVVEGGKFPVKMTLGEELVISADIFCDGHDEVNAVVLAKREQEKEWKEFPMQMIGNDHWEMMLYMDAIGFYHFQVQGWIDHFTTWKKGLKKKFEAGQDITVELQIGALMLEDAAERAEEKEKISLLRWADGLRNPGNPEHAVLFSLADEIAGIMYRNTDRSLASTYPVVFRIEAERKKAAFSAWYELFPRSAAPEPGRHGTFNDVKRLLPRVSEMGFDVLYFPPIHPIGEVNRKGKNNSLTPAPGDPGSPWAIGNKRGGHKDILPELGTLKDLRSLIAAAAKYDIEIAMDIAYQCAPDHPWVKEHPQWFRWRPDGTVQYAENPPKKYEDILPINFETEDWQALWEELKSVIDYWVAQGVNIFRIDNPHTKAFHFWEWMIREVRQANPQVIFLAEAFTRPRLMERLGKGGFNQSYTYFTWRNTKQELEEYLTQLTKTDMRYYYRPNFWPNTPDILPPEITAGGENKLIIRLLLAATLSSNYGLYGPVYEFGFTMPMPGKEEYIHNEKYEIWHWDWDRYTKIREVITRINRIRKENPALHSTWNIEFAPTTNDQIICYCKTDPKTGNILIIAINLDPFHTHSAQVKIPIQELGIEWGIPYTVRDLLTGDKFRWHNDWNYVELNPYDLPAHVFRVER